MVRDAAGGGVVSAAKQRAGSSARPRGTERPTGGTGADRTQALARLWAPWRMTWLKRAAAPQGCLFCRVAAAKAEADKAKKKVDGTKTTKDGEALQ